MPIRDKEKQKLYMKNWRTRNKDSIRQYEKDNNDKRVAQSRIYHANHYKKHSKEIRAKSLKKFYNLSNEEYNQKVVNQDGKCSICDRTAKDKLVVDHNHQYGFVRGLLCNQCNLAIGLMKENPLFINQASKYINHHIPKNGNVLITGVTGQIGSYLAELCLEKGHKVYGLQRRISSESKGHCPNGVEILHGDLTDISSLERAIQESKPVYFFNLAAQSHVGHSFKDPINTSLTTGIGVINCLEAIRQSGLHIRFLQASTSEMFGGIQIEAANESTPFYPKSPYGVAKLMAHWATINYRESYNFFSCAAIMFNNESPRRGPEFVTRKITRGIADIKVGKIDSINLGNLDACRDWSFTGDFVEGLYLQLVESAKPQELVFASGESHSVREFCKIAFDYAGLGDYERFVKIDPKLYRPAEVKTLLGDSSKAKRELGWEPKISFIKLVQSMVDSDLGNANIKI